MDQGTLKTAALLGQLAGGAVRALGGATKAVGRGATGAAKTVVNAGQQVAPVAGRVATAPVRFAANAAPVYAEQVLKPRPASQTLPGYLWNVANTIPFDPYLRKVAPRTAAALRWGQRGVMGASAAAGAAAVPGILSRGLSDAGAEILRGTGERYHDAQFAGDELGRNLLPIATGTLVSPEYGGDHTLVGDVHRDVVRDTAIPYARNQLYAASQRGTPGKVLDVVRSLSPLGAVSTGLMYALRDPSPPDVQAAVQRSLRSRLPAGTAPSPAAAGPDSPLLSLYTDAIRHGRERGEAFRQDLASRDWRVMEPDNRLERVWNRLWPGPAVRPGR